MTRTIACLMLVMLAGCAGGGGPRADDHRRFIGTAGEPSTVIATELAFARAAREKGTWTAFRRFATDDALWPGPNWENVQAALKGRADPAQPILWEPDRVVLSCDGSFALSTGPATHPAGRKSRFATIWQRQTNGDYRWVLDQGFDLEAGSAGSEFIAAEVAECPAGKRPASPGPARRGLAWQSGESDDGTLSWTTALRPDCSRELVVSAKRGGAMVEVFRQVAPPPPAPAGQGPQAVCA